MIIEKIEKLAELSFNNCKNILTQTTNLRVEQPFNPAFTI